MNRYEKRGYDKFYPGANLYSVISARLRYAKHLDIKSLRLYLEMSALFNVEGDIYVGDDYFVSVFGYTYETVARCIDELLEEGCITAEFGSFNDGEFERKISRNDCYYPGVEE